MSETKKKRGRPAKPGSRRNRVYVYLSDMELDILKNASETSGKSISEIARIGTLKSSSDVLTSSICDDEDIGFHEDDDFYDD